MTLAGIKDKVVARFSEGTAAVDGASEDVLAKPRKRLANISPEAYRHPLDKQATATLRAVPGFEYAVRKLSRFSLEQILYLEMLASAVKVTPKQCGRIHELLEEACAVLDVPVVPALFLTQNPIVNAFAMGRERPTLVLHTGLIEHLNEEEILGVIAHELGHVHCGHTVYRLMALLIELAAKYGDRLIGGPAFSLPIQGALLEWVRKAELSADRAAVLVTQNPDVVFSALFKLTGGSPKVFSLMDRDEYLKQAEEYEHAEAPKLDRFYKSLIEAGKTHPIPVLRGREALRWGASDQYRDILAGRYARREKNGDVLIASGAKPDVHIRCAACGEETDAGAFSFCTNCGADVRAAEVAEALGAVAAAADAVTPNGDGDTDA